MIEPEYLDVDVDLENAFALKNWTFRCYNLMSQINQTVEFEVYQNVPIIDSSKEDMKL